MSEAEAIAHIKAADADGNMAIDFAEFGKLWEALHGAEEVGKIESCQRTKKAVKPREGSWTFLK